MQEYTTFDEIYHLFLNSIKDYKLASLFREYVKLAEDQVDTYFFRAITEFPNCKKDLNNIDRINRCFRFVLTQTEIDIIVDLMILKWVDHSINDISQMRLNLPDNDFKIHAEEKNLRGKSDYANILRERVSQRKVEYGLYNTPFNDWADGNYGI